MQASLRALLTGIIDYAGLFPPAQLPLDQAARSYVHYRGEAEAWMLGRFICPTSRLGELVALVRCMFTGGPSLAIAALGRSGNSADEFAEGLTLDLEAINAFRQAHGSHVLVDVFEARLPPEAGVDVIEETIELVRQQELALFLEGGAVATIARACSSTGQSAGVKMRCGGLDANTVPSVHELAGFIQECGAADLPMKFTAGLHHPLRRFDPGLGTMMHGFVNVFAACVLDALHGLDEKTLREILEEDDAARFRWDDDQLTWAGPLSATSEQIAVVRRRRAVSFGSCSFDEPRDDLRQLGWL